MKNFLFLFLICFCIGCSNLEEKTSSETNASNKGTQVIDKIVYSDEKVVYFSSNWENKSGSEAFKKLIKPLLGDGIDVVVDFLTVYENDEKILEASLCFDSLEKANSYKMNALEGYEAWSSTSDAEFIAPESLLSFADGSDREMLKGCLDSGEKSNHAKAIREETVSKIMKGHDVEIETSYGVLRTRMLPFLMVGPYVLGSNVTGDQISNLLESFDTSSSVKRSKVIVVEGDCEGCRVETFINKIAGAFGVQYIEWRINGDPVGDKYLKALSPEVLPLIMFENVTIPRNAAEFIETKGSFSVLSGSLYEGVYKIQGLEKIEGGHLEGSPDAPTLHIFEDFECPGCAAFNIREYPELKRNFIDSGLISHSFHHYPLPMHQNAYEAAIASECAHDQGKFWEYKDVLFANQKSLSGSDLLRYASELGMDLEAFRSCRNGNEAKARVNRDKETGQKLSLPGTPAFVFPPYRLSDAGSLAYLPFLIDISSEEK